MYLKKKMKNENGSAMVLAIIVIVLAAMVMIILSKQVINQIVVTKRTQNSIQKDYKHQADVEKSIGDFLTEVSVKEHEKDQTEKPEAAYNASKSIVYRVERMIKANLLEIQILNNQMQIGVDHEGQYLEDKSGEDKYIGQKMLELYDGRHNLIDQLQRCSQYVANVDGNGATTNTVIYNNIDLINVNLDTMENNLDSVNQYLSDKKLNPKQQRIKKLIEESQDYTKYLIYELNNNFPYYSYNNELNSSYVNSLKNEDLVELENNLKNSKECLENIKKSVEKLKPRTNYSDINNQYESFVNDNIDTITDILNGGYIDELKSEIENLKNGDYSENEKSVILISLKLDALYNDIGKYQNEKRSMDIFNYAVPKKDVGVEYWGENVTLKNQQSLIKAYAQNIRRGLKGIQVQAKYMKYEINKAFINQYSREMQSDISDNIIQKNLEDGVNESILNLTGSNIISSNINTQISKLNTVITDINDLNEGYSSDGYVRYDNKIKDILSIDDVVSGLYAQETQLQELYRTKNADKQKIDIALENINNAINSLRKLRMIFNGVYSDGDHKIEEFTEKGKITISFPFREKTIVKVNDLDYTARINTEASMSFIKVNKGSNVDIEFNARGSKIVIEMRNIESQSSYNINYKILDWN